jgi:UDP-2,3-diacylglucosamine pyrophosphatase LpxH
MTNLLPKPSRDRFEKHLFLADPHILDQNKIVVKIVVDKFIPEFKPNYIYLVGDLLNFTYLSKFDVEGKAATVGEEIKGGMNGQQ